MNLIETMADLDGIKEDMQEAADKLVELESKLIEAIDLKFEACRRRDELEAELASRPTQEAYDAATKALWKHRDAEQRLQTFLNDAWQRMDRARDILTDSNPRPECNWGMLDTKLDREAYEDRSE